MSLRKEKFVSDGEVQEPWCDHATMGGAGMVKPSHSTVDIASCTDCKSTGRRVPVGRSHRRVDSCPGCGGLTERQREN